MNGVVGNTYQLNWSYLSGCITTTTAPLNVDVNMLADPIPSLNTASNLCENGDLIFTASNGVSYDWATGTQGNTKYDFQWIRYNFQCNFGRLTYLCNCYGCKWVYRH